MRASYKIKCTKLTRFIVNAIAAAVLVGHLNAKVEFAESAIYTPQDLYCFLKVQSICATQGTPKMKLTNFETA